MKIDIEAFKKPCACGHKHDVVVEDIIIEKGAVEKLPEIMKRTSFADKKNVVMLNPLTNISKNGWQIPKHTGPIPTHLEMVNKELGNG